MKEILCIIIGILVWITMPSAVKEHNDQDETHFIQVWIWEKCFDSHPDRFYEARNELNELLK